MLTDWQTASKFWIGFSKQPLNKRTANTSSFWAILFHERSKIDVLNYLRTFEVFMKHMIEDAADREVYLLVGNHDMYHRERWDINSIKPLSAIPGVHIVQSPMSMQLGGRKIDWLPYTENPIARLPSSRKRAWATYCWLTLPLMVR
jgi:hypothetical protein